MVEDGEKRRISLSRLALVGIAAVAILGALVLGIGLGGDDSAQTEEVALVDAPYLHGDASSTRRTGGPIRGDNVARLEAAWTVPLAFKGEGEGSSAVPVVAGGTAYMQDVRSDVQAIDLASGEIVWEREYGTEQRRRNGVVVADGRVYGATDEEAFALDQQTGEELWSTRLVEDDSSHVDMAPGYHEGLVYLATSPAAADGGEVGVLWALDARTGRKVWSFDTVPRGLWGNPRVNFGGGVSHPPTFDGEGSMYFGVASPGPRPGTAQFPWGSSRPGPNLYSNSVVKLDAKTGKLQWYYQVTPHAVCNWDVGSTMLVRAGGRELVIAGSQAGVVVAVDRETGKLVWRTAVGRHNGHDDDGLVAMRGEYSKLKTPVTVFPGGLGGVYGAPASDGSTLYVPVLNQGTTLYSQTAAENSGNATGQLAALDLATGAVQGAISLSSPLLGAVSVVNDLIFVATFDGTLYAFDGDTGRSTWRTRLPAGSNAGVTVSGDTLLAPAGNGQGGKAAIAAYRLQS